MADTTADVDAVKQMVAGAFAQVAKDLGNVDKKAREATSSSGGFVKLDELVTGMAKKLLGPVGLAAGFYKVAESLESVAKSSVQLQAFARDTGFAVESVEGLRQAYRRLGSSNEEANVKIATFGGLMQNLALNRQSDETYQQLIKGGEGGVKFANGLLQIAEEGLKTGDQMKSLTQAVKLYQAQTDPRAQLFIAQTLHMTRTEIEDLIPAMERNIEVWPRAEGAAKKYHETWVGLETSFDNIFNNIADHAIEKMNAIFGAQGKEGETAQKIAKSINAGTDEIIAEMKTTLREIDGIMKAYDAFKLWLDKHSISEAVDKATENLSSDKARDSLSGAFDKFRGTKPGDFSPANVRDSLSGSFDKFHSTTPGNVWDNLSPDKVSNSFSERFGKFRSPSSGSHSDITDFGGMRRSESVEDDNNSLLRDVRDILQRMEIKDDDRSGGGATSYQDYGTGIRSEGGKAQAGLGGFRRFRGGGDSGGGDGATPPGSGPHAGGVTTNQRNVAQIMNDEWSRAGMSKKGTAGIMANVQDESRFDPTLRHPDQPHFSGEAHYAHGLYQEGGTEWNNYAAWLQANYPDADWKDPRMQSRFAAERLKSGYPKTWQKMNAASSAGEAGSIYVDEYLKPAAGYRAGRMAKYQRGVPDVEHYTGSMDRDRIDQAQSGGDKWGKGAINAKVEFLNVPNGVRTNADSDGDVFKQLQISRTKQSGVYSAPLGYE